MNYALPLCAVRNSSTIYRTFLASAFVATLVGCGSGPATSERWQDEVRRHVAQEGHGDVNILRQLPAPHGRPVFASRGGNDPASTSDFVGVLLDQPTIGNRPTCVFLVARVKNRIPEDMRLAAVYDDGGDDTRPAVQFGDDDDDANDLYIQHYRPANTVDALWPPASDVYELTASGNTVTVTEKTSGAKWTIQVRAER